MSRVKYKRVSARELGLERLGTELPQFFSPWSWRNRPLRDDQPIVSDGNNYAAHLARQARYSTSSIPRSFYSPPYQSIINVGSPIFVATPDHPRGRVNIVDNLGNGGVGGTQFPDDVAYGLPLEFLDVPFPPGVDNFVSFGDDYNVQIYDPVNDTIYEFFRFFKSTQFPPYAARWGGRTRNLSRASPITLNSWGASASGIAQSAGMIRAQELIDGEIGHIINVFLPVVSAGHLPPAQRDDGLTYGSAIIPGGEFFPGTYQPQLTTLAAPAAIGDTTLSLAARPSGPGPGLYDLDNETPAAAEYRIRVTSFTNDTPSTATLAMPLTKAHDAGVKFSISPYHDAVPEGAMFRFQPDITINPAWTELTKMMVRAIRDHGLLVTDKGSTLSFGYDTGVNLPYNPMTRNGWGNGGESIQQIPWESLVQIEPPAGG